MRFFLKFCVLIAGIGPLALLFMTVIALDGEKTAEELAEAIQGWLES